MALIGDKIKLTNYTYFLSNDGKSIESKPQGSRDNNEKVADIFDIDFRPYSYITYTNVEGGTNSAKTWDYNVTYFSYFNELMDWLNEIYRFAASAYLSPDHYTVGDGTHGTSGDFASLGKYYENEQFITGIKADELGHLTNVTYSNFSISPFKNTNVGSYISSTYLSNGQLSYIYSEINHTNTYTYNNSTVHAYVITNVNLNKSGDFTYSYTDLTTKSGILQGTYTIKHSTAYSILTSITQDSNGKISYTYADFNININGGSLSGDFITNVTIDNDGVLTGSWDYFGTYNGVKNNNTLGNNAAYLIGISIDHAGKISYSYAEINHTTNYTKQNNILIDKSYTYLLTGVNLDKLGNLSYSYSPVRIYHSDYAAYIEKLRITDTTPYVEAQGVITYVYNDVDDVLTFSRQNLSILPDDGVALNSGVDKYLSNTSANTIQLVHGEDKGFYSIKGIKQNKDGKISYSYAYYKLESIIQSNNSVTAGTGNVTITNIYQDTTGKISYEYVNNTCTTGHVNTPASISLSNDVSDDPKRIKLSRLKTIPTQVVTGIIQSSDGHISYQVTNIYTDPKNDYKYHNLTYDTTASNTDINPQSDVVNVIQGIQVSNNGNAISHNISYNSVSVATKKYVDSLMSANDAMRYCGYFIASDTVNNDNVTYNLELHHTAVGIAHTYSWNSTSSSYVSYQISTKPDVDTGAVYKAKESCTVNGIHINAGDYIISNNENASSTDITSGWDIIQGNIDLRQSTVNSLNGNSGLRVLTNISVTNDGLISYTYYNVSVSTDSTFSNFTSHPVIIKGNNAIDINHSNTSNNEGVKIITGVKLDQTNLETKLSYTYTTIYSSQTHHATNSTTIINEHQVLGGVNLNSDGTLSYSYVNIATPTYHYTPTSATYNNGATTNINLIIPANGTNTANKVAAYISYDNFGHIISTSNVTLAHGIPTNASMSNTHGKNFSTHLTTAKKFDFNTDGTYTITGFKTDANGHVGYISYSIITDNKVANFESDKKVYLSGSKTISGTNQSYTNTNVYMENGHLYADKCAYISRNLYVTKNAHISKNILIDKSAYIIENAYIGNDLNVSKNAYISGHAHLVGKNVVLCDKANDSTLILNNGNLDITHTSPLQINGLKALWGTVESADHSFPNISDTCSKITIPSNTDNLLVQ